MPDWIASPSITLPDLDIVGIAAILAGIGAIWLAARGVNRFFKRVNEFFDDWYGNDGDDNHAPQPGVLHRMGSIESEVSSIKAQVGHELNRNGGGSTKDAAHEALRVVKEVQVQQEQEIIARRDWHDRYEADQIAQQRRLMTFFALVRRMITLTPPEQIDLWDEATTAFASGQIPDLHDPEETA